MNQAIIGVGSNIDPKINIKKAEECVRKNMLLIKSSSFEVTTPIGYKEQPDFYNGAWLVECSNSFEWLQGFLHDVENKLMRIRTENKFGPRTIDLDVVVWNKNIIDKDVYTRDFLKRFVLELCPELTNQILI